ncbi:MAG: NADH-quinone oxidoreductase subunit L [Phycisphaerales bacterium JB065]
MSELASNILNLPLLLGASGGESLFTYQEAVDGPGWLGLIPVLPAIAALICLFLLFFARKGIGSGKSRGPAYLVLGFLAVSFIITLSGFLMWNGDGKPVWIVKLFDWINITWNSGDGEQGLIANFSFYFDGLSFLWMLFVTFLGSMICLYASEYMSGDKGYSRFFAAFGLFVASMSCLVLGDNLVMLYLGWEGVGLCSYMLIGYFYTKPEAVAAAKKAFIVNRIGDLGLALGLYLIYTTFGTVQYDELFRAVAQRTDAMGNALDFGTMWQAWAIPCLLMIGAFGKSAQFPLYVWLPDAMEGPTPVSALIHAATMVTAGVYMIARMYPLFLMDPDLHALHAVAWIGTFTALLAATIGMAQFDIKRIMAYSTVSQLGYMFAGLGFLATSGGAYHVFTHAFFKATLFLACGAVMHGFAGQLDLRKLSGLWSQPGWRITSIAMLVGCINLAGLPLTAGYFSKDMILAEAFYTPDSLIHFSSLMGWILLITAGLTAYYTFRVFFRVFVGPEHYEPGDEAHDHDSDEHGEESHHPVEEHADHHADHFHPHPPGWAINLVLATLAIGSLLAAIPYFVNDGNDKSKGWVGDMLYSSTAFYKSPAGHAHHDDEHHDEQGSLEVEHHSMNLVPAQPVVLPARFADAPVVAGSGTIPAADAWPVRPEMESGSILGMDPHKAMYYISAVFGLVGILIAAYLHGPKGPAGLFIGSRTEAATSRADALLPKLGPLPRWAQNKWYVDEFYEATIRLPLWVFANIFHAIDKLLIDGALVDGIASLPRALARAIRPAQSGVLHGYAAGMAAGLGIILLLVWVFSL